MDATTGLKQDVYIGAWTNWSHGKVMGGTITLTKKDGDFLVAVLALFVAHCSTSLFRITCYMLHNIFSSSSPQDAIYHQRQVVLRNSSNGSEAFTNFSKLLWSWSTQGKGYRTYRRVLPSLLYSFVLLLAFGFASVFSSRISALTSDEVLLQYSPPNSSSRSLTYDKDMPNLHRQVARRYSARDCYSPIGTRTCATYVKPRLNVNIDQNAACPFGKNMCKSTNANLRIDTGILDSHWDLGINAPESKRIGFRHVLHCAPLVTEGYVRTENYSDGAASTSYRKYYYGSSFSGPDKPSNFSYVQMDVTSSNESNLVSSGKEWSQTEEPSYGIGTITYSTDTPLWTPIQDLQRSDADVTILFLAASDIVYEGMVEDPWYSAHRPWGSLFYNNGTSIIWQPEHKLYRADDSASPLGCTSQYQICAGMNAQAKNCSALSSQDVVSKFEPSSLNDERYNLTKVIKHVMLNGEIRTIISNLGSHALDSTATLYGGLQIRLPSDQWQKDVIHLMDIILAAMQATSIEWFLNSKEMRELSSAFYMGAFKDEQEGNYRYNQKTRNTAYANFSIFGLALTLVAGVIILLIEAFMADIYVHMKKKSHGTIPYAQMEWHINGVLQLQRLAQEELGLKIWSHCNRSVPLANPRVKLATVRYCDLKHPKLVLPSDLVMPKEISAPQTTPSLDVEISSGGFECADDFESFRDDSMAETHVVDFETTSTKCASAPSDDCGSRIGLKA